MEYSKEDVDRLIDAVGSIVVTGATNPGVAFRRLADLGEAYKPFGKPAQVGEVTKITVYGEDNVCDFKAIELTDAVKSRLGPTAAVDINRILDLFDMNLSNNTFAAEVMQLIADAVPPIDGEL